MDNAQWLRFPPVKRMGTQKLRHRSRQGTFQKCVDMTQVHYQPSDSVSLQRLPQLTIEIP